MVIVLLVLGVIVWAVLIGMAAEAKSRWLIPLATLPIWGPFAVYLAWMVPEWMGWQ